MTEVTVGAFLRPERLVVLLEDVQELFDREVHDLSFG
jgi:hypothetical protein